MTLTVLTGPRKRGLPAIRLAEELILIISGYVGYFAVRGLTEGDAARAVKNADLVIGLERWLHIFWEPALQDGVLRSHALVTASNWVYIWGHWPVILIVGAWLWLHQRPTYYLVRNALLISGAIGLVIFATFPVAPPRLTDLVVVDTVTLHSNAYRVLQPPAFVNQYAAMPSLHFGWDLLIGLALIRTATSRPMRLLGWIMPVLMAVAVILTANHYILDVFAGGVVALTGLLLAWCLQRIPLRPMLISDA
jgi:membrane-associated phospholipid phosphatase